MYHDRENSVGDRRVDENFTIYVNNLPDELNEDGIAQIFKSYGEICSLFTPPNANWAYVSYKTYKEAEHAIRSLNERSPLYLNVSFRKKKIEAKNKNYSEPQDNGAPIEVRDYRIPQNGTPLTVDSGKIMPEMMAINMAQICKKPEVEINSVYPIEPDHNIYNPFESAGRYADTNALWSRGIVNIDEHGKRYVSMGRGYTKYRIAEPQYSQIERQLGHVYERRRAGFYEYGEDRLHNEIGKCQYCGHSAKLRCGKCEGYYCSRQCQVADWPRHKLECNMIPNLIEESDAAALSSSSTDEPIGVARKPRGMMQLGTLNALRRPKTTTSMENAKTVGGRAPLRHEKSTENIKSPRHTGEISNPSILENFVTRGAKHSATKGNPLQSMEKSELLTRDVTCNREMENLQRRIEHDHGKENLKPDSTKSEDKNIQQNFHAGKRPEKPMKVNPENLLIAAKTDYLKLEQELAFQRDSRPQTDTLDKSNSHSEAAPVKIPTIESRATPTIAKTRKREYLISDKIFEKVRVGFVMPDDTFWVSKIEDSPKIRDMVIELQSKVKNYPRVENLVVGEVYGVEFETIWHRAKILSTRPITVQYIDFGTVETCQSTDFRSLKDFTDYPTFAFHLRLSAPSKGKPIALDQELSVKMVGIDDNEIIEVVSEETVDEIVLPKAQATLSQSGREISKEESELQETKIQGKASKDLTSVVDSLKIDDKGYTQVYSALDNDSYAVCVLSNEYTQQYHLIYETLTEVCNEAKKPNDFRPKIGDLICGKRGDVWVRGYVRSLGPPIRLDLVDEARVSPVEEILPVPQKFENICSFGSIIKLENAPSKFEINDAGEFHIKEIVNEGNKKILKGILLSPDTLKGVRFTLKNWNPTPNQKGINFAELKNNSEVCISAYKTERIMYLRGLDHESIERNERMTQRVAKWAQKAPKLDKMPVIGQLVIAKFIDDNYYRATVTNVVDDKISVAYVDYGNTEITTIDNLKLLSDDLKEENSCTSRVILKDIKPDVPPTKEVHQYLDLLVGREQSLICTFDGIPAKDGVVLTMPNGVCVNDKLNTFLIPGWQREDPSKNLSCYMLDDMEMCSLGAVGCVVKAVILCATEPPFKYIMTPFDTEQITHISSFMPELARKYCESTQHYIPRRSELCLALYENAWFRGFCLNRNASPTQAEIQFIDFGNVAIVDHTNIREMTKDFMSPPAIGLSCVVKNLGIELVNGRVPDNVLQRINELAPMNDLIDVKIIRKSSPDNDVEGDYEIELPTVKEKLVEEGLAKP